MEILQLWIDRVATPLGDFLLVCDHQGNLRATSWTDYEDGMRRQLHQHYGENGFTLEPAANPNNLTSAIKSYFAGDLSAIDHLPVQTAGTPFQNDVWHALRKIPCGTTVTYSAIARQIGRPDAVRAVGLANGSNPVGVVVPCHRVIGSDGTLTGYGGGLHRKRWLLDQERVPHQSANLFSETQL
jgi:methylated-DNA-[protein]-cysteine S-methyltransferase